MQTQITHQCVIEEETEEVGEKPLCRPPSSNRSTRQLVGIYGLARDPPSVGNNWFCISYITSSGSNKHGSISFMIDNMHYVIFKI